MGDILVRVDGVGGKSKYKFHRVTMKAAFIKWNDAAEGKFRRVISGFQTAVAIPHPQWNTTSNVVYRPIP